MNNREATIKSSMVRGSELEKEAAAAAGLTGSSLIGSIQQKDDSEHENAQNRELFSKTADVRTSALEKGSLIEGLGEGTTDQRISEQECCGDSDKIEESATRMVGPRANDGDGVEETFNNGSATPTE
jgi:hypothetical protein